MVYASAGLFSLAWAGVSSMAGLGGGCKGARDSAYDSSCTAYYMFLAGFFGSAHQTCC